MKELHSEIEITASAERTWLILTDFASYPRWNPFIRRISGEPTTGEHLEVRLEPPDSRGITLRPTVLGTEPDRELRWLGHLLVSGLFDGEHCLTIQPLPENRVRFVQSAAFRGLLARSLDNSTLRGFEEMNRALKERAEAPLSRSPGDAGSEKEERSTREVELAAESTSPEVSPVADARKPLRPPGPSEAQRFMAERAGAREIVEAGGASHAVAVSRPDEAADVILAAVGHVERLAHHH